MSRSISPLPPSASMACSGTALLLLPDQFSLFSIAYGEAATIANAQSVFRKTGILSEIF
jgi:hypothetical protein